MKVLILALLLGGCSGIIDENYSGLDGGTDGEGMDQDGEDSDNDGSDSDEDSLDGDTEEEESDTETASGDSTDEVLICDPGETQSCTCTTGTEGAQICSEGGQGWDLCECVEDTDSSDGSDTSDTDNSICEYIKCMEFPTNPHEDVKYRSECILSSFPDSVPDSVVHYAAWTGECVELEEGGYECVYQENVVECEMDEHCVQQMSVGDPGYAWGLCLKN